MLVGSAAGLDLTSFASDEACVAAAPSDVASVDDVVTAMRSGLWGCAEILATVAAKGGNAAEVANQVSLEARSLTGRISQLRAALASLAPPTQIITPAFQWAQSPESLFLNIKFSHKLDAPATLDVVVDSVDFTSNSITLRVRRISPCAGRSATPHSHHPHCGQCCRPQKNGRRFCWSFPCAGKSILRSLAGRWARSAASWSRRRKWCERRLLV